MKGLTLDENRLIRLMSIAIVEAHKMLLREGVCAVHRETARQDQDYEPDTRSIQELLKGL